jgi:hypothetical protein
MEGDEDLYRMTSATESKSRSTSPKADEMKE